MSSLMKRSNKEANESSVTHSHCLLLLQLPLELVERILNYLTYDETSSSRLVCKLFNVLCEKRLNVGFARAERLHGQIQREVRSKLPRRESERRSHALARHVDVLSAVETRISLLSMTYTRYIELGVGCFVPGKVLDEMFNVLHKINLNTTPPRAHEMLQELRDISSMAMEHFDEKIVPELKLKLQQRDSKPISHDSSDSDIESSVEQGISCLFESPALFGISRPTSDIDVLCASKETDDTTKTLHQQLIAYRSRVLHLEKRLCATNRRLTKQDRKLSQKSLLLNELNRKMVEQSRRNFDFEQKFTDVMNELARVRSSCCSGDAQACVVSTRQATRCGGVKRKSLNNDITECRVEKVTEACSSDDTINTNDGRVGSCVHDDVNMCLSGSDHSITTLMPQPSLTTKITEPCGETCQEQVNSSTLSPGMESDIHKICTCHSLIDKRSCVMSSANDDVTERVPPLSQSEHGKKTRVTRHLSSVSKHVQHQQPQQQQQYASRRRKVIDNTNETDNDKDSVQCIDSKCKEAKRLRI